MDHRTRCPAKVAPRENRCICALLDEAEGIGVKIGLGKAIRIVVSSPEAACRKDHIDRSILLGDLRVAS